MNGTTTTKKHINTIATLENTRKETENAKNCAYYARLTKTTTATTKCKEKPLQKQCKWYRNEWFNAHGKRKTKSDKLTSILHIFVYHSGYNHYVQWKNME